MSAISAPVSVRPGSPADPYYYGWRDIPTTDADGKTKITRVPLTLEDCLHPQMGDVIVEGSLHENILTYLSAVLRSRFADDPTVLVLSDVGVYWDDPDIGHHSPDLAVIFDVHERRENWTGFYVAQQKTRPRLIIEVVSPNTRSNDVVKKINQYHRVRVPIYVVVDRVEDEWKLDGYLWTPTHYLPMPADELGRLWLEPLNAWLALKGEGLILIDGATGQEIGDYTTVSKQLHAEAARADAEAARAEAEAAARLAAEAKIRELEERLARLSGGSQPTS